MALWGLLVINMVRGRSAEYVERPECRTRLTLTITLTLTVPTLNLSLNLNPNILSLFVISCSQHVRYYGVRHSGPFPLMLICISSRTLYYQCAHMVAKDRQLM